MFSKYKSTEEVYIFNTDHTQVSMNSVPMPKKNYDDNSPTFNDYIDNEELEINIQENIQFTLSEEIIPNKKNSIIVNCDYKSFEKEEKCKTLIDQNERLINSINSLYKEKDLWKEKYELLENNMKTTIKNLQKSIKEALFDKTSQFTTIIKEMQLKLYEKQMEIHNLKTQFLEMKNDSKKNDNMKNDKMKKYILNKRSNSYNKLNDNKNVNFVNHKRNHSTNKSKKAEYLALINFFNMHDKLIYKYNSLEERLDLALENIYEINHEKERFSYLNDEKQRQIDFLQTKIIELENNESKNDIDNILNKTNEIINCLENENNKYKETIIDKENEINEWKEKFQNLSKESNERIEILVNHYDISRKAFEKEIEENYEYEKKMQMLTFEEILREKDEIIDSLKIKSIDITTPLKTRSDFINIRSEMSTKCNYKENDEKM